jgi:hypothetical protein
MICQWGKCLIIVGKYPKINSDTPSNAGAIKNPWKIETSKGWCKR